MNESYPDDLLNYFENNHLEINSNFYNKLINQVERLINKEYHNINLILINNPNLNNEKGYQDLKNESRINNLKKWKAYLNERRLKCTLSLKASLDLSTASRVVHQVARSALGLGVRLGDVELSHLLLKNLNADNKELESHRHLC